MQIVDNRLDVLRGSGNSNYGRRGVLLLLSALNRQEQGQRAIATDAGVAEVGKQTVLLRVLLVEHAHVVLVVGGQRLTLVERDGGLDHGRHQHRRSHVG